MTQQRVSPITVTSLLPATVLFRGQAALGQSADLLQLNNSSGTNLAKFDSAGLLTVPNLAVTSTTIPANGVYLPAANTLGFATNSAVRMQINSVGEIGLGGNPSTGSTLWVTKTITGSASANGIVHLGTIQSDVTTNNYYFRAYASTAAASFTLGTLAHFFADQGTFGLGSTVTTQIGFFAGSALTGGTNNYGFYGQIASGSARWNAYMVGTAANYFAGQTTVGSTSLTLGSGSVAQQFGVVAGAATTVGAVIRGAASQTANLQEWQNSAGSVLSYVSSSGLGSFKGLSVYGTAYASGSISGLFESAATTNIPLAVRGTTSQSADLQQWQNVSTTVLAKIDATGNIVVGNMAIATSSVATIHISNGTIPSANPTGGGVLYVEGGALKYRGSSGTVTTIANA